MSDAGWRWLWRGDLPPRALRIRDDGAPAPLPPALLEAIAADWRERLAAAAASGCRLFDGALAQWRGHREAEGGLQIELGRTSYSHWLFSAGRQEEIEAAHGAGCASRPLAVCAALISRDGLLCVTRRSMTVAEGAGLLHLIGGHLDPGRHRRGGAPDPELAMRSELEEELGLTEAELSGARMLGLGVNRENGKPELLYRYRSALTGEAIRERSRSARDRFECAQLQLRETGPASLRALLERPAAEFAPPGRALIERLLELSPPTAPPARPQAP